MKTVSPFDLVQNFQFKLLGVVLNNLKMYNFDIDSQNSKGNTLLHYLAAVKSW